jgi:hypothetical protein
MLLFKASVVKLKILSFNIIMKKTLLLSVVLLIILNPAFLGAKERERSFALVVDSETYKNCKAAIDAYAGSIKAEELLPLVIVDKWQNPDSLRKILYKNYRENNLEGAVFIGDIPVPMIRNAQHLTTAFKMDQRRPWELSSIPSDRFYDDFDLNFEFLKRDTVNKNLFYYNLSAQGPHNIRCDIYSARIKPPKIEGKNSYTLINEYLQKVVKEKSDRRAIKNLTYFAGHGYNSEDMVARIDEKATLLTQFGIFRSGKGTLNYIDYTYDDYVKYRLMAELSREDLDLAILHHHGAEDTQYLNGSPIVSMPDRWLELSRKFFRSKIRGSKDTAASKAYYIKNYNVPESWVSDAFDPAVMKKDSIDDASVDIHINDLKGYKPNARFIIFDACFNGAFQNDDYISGHYIFSDGKTVVVKANSVNTLQDTWTNQLIGLLDLGVSIGNWAKGMMTLESHLIGDPTYRYAVNDKKYDDLDEEIALSRNVEPLWKKYLKSPIGEVRGLAIKMLAESGKITPAELFEIQKEDKDPLIRLQAFNLLRKHYNPFMLQSIQVGLRDNYELIRRFAAMEASNNLSAELADEIFEIRVAPGTSMRVDFQLKGAGEQYSPEIARAAFDKALQGKSGTWYEGAAAEKKALNYTLDRTKKEMAELLDPAIPAKTKRFTITSLRNSTNIAYLDTLFKFMKESKDNDLRELLAEAFGWYTNSSARDKIIEFLQETSKNESNTKVKFELDRSVSRLLNIPN